MAEPYPKGTPIVSLRGLNSTCIVWHAIPYIQVKIFTMARKKKQLILTQPVRSGIKAIKVRLDQRTIITLSDLKKLAFWKERYPQAEVIG